MANRTPMEPLIKYRPDIDGLRAVAVLSVVLYHLGLPLHGGFVGVDIFFTISGFLIGSIILRQVGEGTFTFVGFYERRLRRICPALFAMLFVSLFIAYRYLLPSELTDFVNSMTAAALSVSNIYFFRETGYFDGPAGFKPLLHTWSLGVEEQFYLLLPILLVLLHRYTPRKTGTWVIRLAVLSLVISVYMTLRHPSASFYLAGTRAWELLCGTILALDTFPSIRRPVLRNLAGFAGIALICGSVWLYDASTPFPGLGAIPPCLGTALVIAAGRTGPHAIGRLLSLRPVVFVGLISYSLYLWHWPLIVFRNYGLTIVNGLNTHQMQLLIFTLSILLAILSWRFIEIPFRTRVLCGNRRILFTSAAAALVIVVVLRTSIVASQGAVWRFSPQTREIAAYLQNDPHDSRNQYRNGTCFITDARATLRDFPVKECLPRRTASRTLLLLGDSHAASMWWGLDLVLPDVNVMQATASGCKPVIHQRPRQYPACTAIMDYALKDYLLTNKVDAVLIEAHWDEGDMDSLGETLQWLRQRCVPVILFGPIVQYDSPLPRLLAMSISHGDPQLPRRHLLSVSGRLDGEMAALAQQDWHVPYVSLINLLCNKGVCTEYAAPDVPLQSDYGHLTKAGSVLVAEKVAALDVLHVDLATALKYNTPTAHYTTVQ